DFTTSFIRLQVRFCLFRLVPLLLFTGKATHKRVDADTSASPHRGAPYKHANPAAYSESRRPGGFPLNGISRKV
ncbi:MAG TPA: hypothetical protein PL025_03405, partial [Anaerolineaceae bacterium]|nr:hypothetical protein [Anaerolineaceae bacterium]